MTKDNTAWLELAVKCGNMGAWYWDLNDSKHTIVRNEHYDRIYGLESDELWTRELWIRQIHPTDRPKVLTKIQDVMNGKNVDYQIEYRVIRQNGDIRWIKAVGKGIHGRDGEITHVAGVVSDVTEVKGLRQERDLFLATLTHDLRNAITAILANAELARKRPDRVQDRDQLLDKIIAGSDRMDRMIRDLLDVSRARESRAIRLVFQECDLQLVLQEAIRDLNSQHGDRLRFQASGDFAGRWAADGLRRVLENLVSNAFKYGAANRLVHVKLARDGDAVVLSVRNEGSPIPKEEQETLFEPFRRGGAEKGDQPGWGLGLAAVRTVSDALHGRVHVESTEETGTTFTLEFDASADRESKIAS